MTELKILSVNCRGLADRDKRKDVFHFLRDKKCSIFCLQDTHFTASDLNYIRSQWGYNIYCSPGSRESRGVTVLFNNNFEYRLINEKSDTAGNLILLELEIEKRFTINLINIYGPNQDSPKFYSDLSGYLSDSSNDFTIICGDFNLVQDFNLDCSNYKSLNNSRARLELLKLKDTIYKIL